ncbi:transcription initiation factor IIB [Chytridiales sp. JEL 0842]|nr:transcription initiation factor IIB [Chytridiales sp. JEL 0842]
MTFVSNQAIGPQRPTMDLNFKLICKDCKNPVPNIVEEFAQGDLVCGDCGLVLGNRIVDTRSEWRTFSNSDDAGDDPSRVGAAGDALLGGNNHLESTTISKRDGGSGMAKELSRIHGKISTVKGEKSLLANFKDIQAMSERIGLARVVVDSAKQLFKKVEDEKILRGKSVDAIKASCIYLACREHHVTRTFKEICALTNVSKKEIGRCYKLLQPLFETPMNQVSLDSLISRFASEIELQESVRNLALQFAVKTTEAGILAGKSTISLVAASLYFAVCLSETPKPASEVARIAGCTEATLKNGIFCLDPSLQTFTCSADILIDVAYRSMYAARTELMKGIKTPKGMEALPVS